MIFKLVIKEHYSSWMGFFYDLSITFINDYYMEIFVVIVYIFILFHLIKYLYFYFRFLIIHVMFYS